MAVLWILGALATLATIYAVYVADTATALRMHDESVQMEAMVTAGLELTVHRIVGINDFAPTSGRFTFHAGDTRAVVDYRSEAGRIDLNAASKELLAGLFTTLGAGPAAAEFYAERIIGWRTPVNPQRAGHRNLYVSHRWPTLWSTPRAVPAYGRTLARARFAGVSGRACAAVCDRLQRARQVNIFDSAPEVIAALPGMTPARLHRVLAQRDAGRQNARRIDGGTRPGQGSRHHRRKQGDAGHGARQLRQRARMNSEVVIFVRDSGTEPYSVLSWRGHLDEAAQ